MYRQKCDFATLLLRVGYASGLRSHKLRIQVDEAQFSVQAERETNTVLKTAQGGVEAIRTDRSSNERYPVVIGPR